MVTFGSLLFPWLITFPRHHAFCKKGTKLFFFVNILQQVNKNVSNNIFLAKIESPNVIL
jgi:hypothetical protein